MNRIDLITIMLLLVLLGIALFPGYKYYGTEQFPGSVAKEKTPKTTVSKSTRDHGDESMNTVSTLIQNRTYHVTFIIKLTELPELIGARFDSLEAAIYDGKDWRIIEIWIWNGTRKVVSPFGSIIEMPNAGWYLTKNCYLIIKVPTYIINKYVCKWPRHLIYDKINNRLYIEINQTDINVSFYIFYSKYNSAHKYPFLTVSKYRELKKKAIEISRSDIALIKYENISSCMNLFKENID